jgi:hypothetical protein
MKTFTAQEEEDCIYVPKGGMCSACTKSLDDCSSLDFKSMKVMHYGTENVATVKCTGFTLPIKPIKPAKKIIDLSVLIDSQIDCEFSDTPDFKELYISKMIKTDWRTCIDYNSCHNNMYGGTSYCRPRMNHKHAWDGGECPIEGFVVRVWYNKDTSSVTKTSVDFVDWERVIYVMFLKVEDGYVMPYGGEL